MYEALRVLGSEFGHDALQQIVSIRGSNGDPQPEKWKIILEDPQGGGVRELQVADGKIDSDDEAGRDVAGSTEGATIDSSRCEWKDYANACACGCAITAKKFFRTK